MRAFAKRLEAVEAYVAIAAIRAVLLIIDDDSQSDYFCASGRTSSEAKANYGALPDAAHILEIYFDDHNHTEQTGQAALGN